MSHWEFSCSTFLIKWLDEEIDNWMFKKKTIDQEIADLTQSFLNQVESGNVACSTRSAWLNCLRRAPLTCSSIVIDWALIGHIPFNEIGSELQTSGGVEKETLAQRDLIKQFITS